MQHYDLLTVRRQLTKILDRLGETGPVVITRYGQPVAQLVPAVDAHVEIPPRGPKGAMVRVNSTNRATRAVQKAEQIGRDLESETTVAMDTAEAVVTKARRPGEYTTEEMEQINRERLAKTQKRKTK